MAHRCTVKWCRHLDTHQEKQPSREEQVSADICSHRSDCSARGSTWSTDYRSEKQKRGPAHMLYEIHNGATVWLLNCYVSTLLIATIDKFYAVIFPFTYQLKHQFFLKIALLFAFGLNLLPTAVVVAERFIRQVSRGLWTVFVYNIVLVLALLVTIMLFLAIVAKLVHNGRKLRKRGPAHIRLI